MYLLDSGTAAKYWSAAPFLQKLTTSNLRNLIWTGLSKVKLTREADSIPDVFTRSSSTSVCHGPFSFCDPDTLNPLVAHPCLPFPVFLI